MEYLETGDDLTDAAVPPTREYSTEERVQIFRAFYLCDLRETEQQEEARANVAILITRLYPGAPAMGPAPSKALREQFARTPTWTQDCSINDVWTYVRPMWCSMLGKLVPPAAIGSHPRMKNRRYFRWELTHRHGMRGMAIFLCLYICKGPTFRPTKRNGHYTDGLVPDMDMPDEIRYGVFIPLLQLLWMYGDPERVLAGTSFNTWTELMNTKQMGWFIEGATKAVNEHGIWSYDQIAEWSAPNHPKYTEDHKILKKWHAGLQYEIAMVLRLLVPDFPQPPGSKWFVTPEQKANYKARFLEHGGEVITCPW